MMTEYEYNDLAIKLVIANALVSMMTDEDLKAEAEEEIMEIAENANIAYDGDMEPYAARR